MEKLDKKFWIMLGLIIIVVGFFITYMQIKLDAPNYPHIDVIHHVFYGTNWVKNWQIGVNSSLNSIAPIFGIRASYISEKGLLYPASNMGYILIIGIFSIINKNLIFLINIFFLSILSIYGYKLFQNKFKNKVYGLIFISLFIFSFSVLYWGQFLMTDIPSLAVGICAIYYLTKNKKNEFKNKVIALILGIIAIYIRCTAIFFILPFFIIYLLKIDKKNIKHLLILFLISICLITPLLYFNQTNYNTPLGYVGGVSEKITVLSPNQEFLNKKINETILTFPTEDNKEIFSNNFNNYIWIYSIFIILSFFGLFFLDKKFNVSLILSTSLILLLYLGKIWSGYSRYFDPSSMYTRYFLPIYFFIFFLSAGAVTKLKNKFKLNKKIKIILIFLLLITSLVITFNFLPAQINKNLANHDLSEDFKQTLEQYPQNKTIVFTNYYDKFIFPYRQTAIYSTFPENERINKTIEIIKLLLSKNYTILIANEDKLSLEYTYDIFKLDTDYFPPLKKEDYNIIKINNYLYEIKR